MSFEILLREANDLDIPSMALITERANAARAGNPLPTQLQGSEALDDVSSRSQAASSWSFLAAHEGTPVGFALGYPSTETDSISIDDIDVEYLALLMVDPDHWRNGIASRLVDRTIVHCRKIGKRELFLLTAKDNNHGSRRFYDNYGFGLTGRIRHSSDTDRDTAVEYRFDLTTYSEI